jgi:hypothetical protein
VNTINQLQ